MSVFFQAEDGIRDLTVTGVQTCALPILWLQQERPNHHRLRFDEGSGRFWLLSVHIAHSSRSEMRRTWTYLSKGVPALDRKSTRLNSSHSQISYAVFCLKKKKKKTTSLQY